MTPNVWPAWGILERFASLLNEAALSFNKQFGYLTITKYVETKHTNSFIKLGLARELLGRQRNRVFVYDRYFPVLDQGTEPL